MKRFWPSVPKRHSGILIVLLCGLFIGEPAALSADGKGFFTTRRALGVVFLGSGAALAKKGFDYRQDADEFYGLYERATDPEEITLLYQRTTNRDVKSQVSWALAAAFAISGLRLMLTREAEAYEDREAPRRVEVRGWRIEPQIDHRRMALQLKKVWGFF